MVMVMVTDGYYRLLLQRFIADSGSLTSGSAATIGIIATGALRPLASGCSGPMTWDDFVAVTWSVYPSTFTVVLNNLNILQSHYQACPKNTRSIGHKTTILRICLYRWTNENVFPYLNLIFNSEVEAVTFDKVETLFSLDYGSYIPDPLCVCPTAARVGMRKTSLNVVLW